MIAALALVFGCVVSKAEPDHLRPGLKTPPPVPVEIRVPVRGSAAQKAEWTIMVYINGKNDLESAGIAYLKQLESVGSTGRINIVAELGRYKNDDSNGNWSGCRRYFLEKSGSTGTITSPPLDLMGKCDMGDYAHAVEFGRWAMTGFPAEHYMYIVWNHGTGWDNLKRDNDKGISYDEETGNHFSTPQLGLLLKELGHVDIFRSEACLMQMAEVAYELKDYADYIVASEENESTYRWAADDWLNKIISAGDLSPLAVAVAAVDTTRQRTQSCVRTAALPRFVSLLNDFAGAVMNSGGLNTARDARDNAQSYDRENKDIYHFASLLAGSSGDAAVKNAAQALLAYIPGTLVPANKTRQDYADSHGLAIFLPGVYSRRSYSELAFAKNSGWPAFIQWLLSEDTK
jgi:hypothetical protein